MDRRRGCICCVVVVAHGIAIVLIEIVTLYESYVNTVYHFMHAFIYINIVLINIFSWFVCINNLEKYSGMGPTVQQTQSPTMEPTSMDIYIYIIYFLFICDILN